MEIATVTYRRESLADALTESWPLLERHYQEIAHYADIPLAPDIEQYLAWEQAGILRAYSVRLGMGTLIGYAVYLIRPHPHYRSSLTAIQDILFILPEHRGRGLAFIDWCDQQLKAENVQVVLHHCKAAHDFGRALMRLGYEKIDIIYGRRLDR